MKRLRMPLENLTLHNDSLIRQDVFSAPWGYDVDTDLLIELAKEDKYSFRI